MKKIIGLSLWLLAFLFPLRYALLDTSDLQGPDGAQNIKGLINFVALVALVFVGYFLVDSHKAPASDGDQHH